MAKRLISLCGECGSYDWKKHRCTRGAKDLGKTQDPFYKDCPLPKGAEVVTCGECKYYALWADGRYMHYCDKHDSTTYDNDFCSYGERKEG